MAVEWVAWSHSVAGRRHLSPLSSHSHCVIICSTTFMSFCIWPVHSNNNRDGHTSENCGFYNWLTWRYRENHSKRVPICDGWLGPVEEHWAPSSIPLTIWTRCGILFPCLCCDEKRGHVRFITRFSVTVEIHSCSPNQILKPLRCWCKAVGWFLFSYLFKCLVHAVTHSARRDTHTRNGRNDSTKKQKERANTKTVKYIYIQKWIDCRENSP